MNLFKVIELQLSRPCQELPSSTWRITNSIALIFLAICGCTSEHSSQATMSNATPIPSVQPSTTSGSVDSAVQSIYNTPSIHFDSLEQDSSVVYETGRQTAFRFESGTSENAVLRNTGDVAQFLARHPEASQTPSPFPSIDFSSNVGILVFVGSANYYSMVEIVGIEEQSNALLVHSILWDRDGASEPGLVTTPFHLVSIPIPTKPIVFAPIVQADFSLRTSAAIRNSN